MTREESRAVGFVGILLLLAVAARFASRPRPMTITAGPIDLAAFRAAGEALQQVPKNGRGRGRKRPATTSTHAPPAESAARRTQKPPIFLEGRNSDERAPAGPLNLNRASAAELEKLPGIGPAMAKRIIARRDSVGRFEKLEDLDAIRGIGPALLQRLEPLVVIR